MNILLRLSLLCPLLVIPALAADLSFDESDSSSYESYSSDSDLAADLGLHESGNSPLDDAEILFYGLIELISDELWIELDAVRNEFNKVNALLNGIGKNLLCDELKSSREELLYTAVTENMPDILELLIEMGFEVDFIIKDVDDDLSPAMYAAKQDDWDILTILIGAGANLTVKNSHGMNAWDYAMYDESKLLIKHRLSHRSSREEFGNAFKVAVNKKYKSAFLIFLIDQKNKFNIGINQAITIDNAQKAAFGWTIHRAIMDSKGGRDGTFIADVWSALSDHIRQGADLNLLSKEDLNELWKETLESGEKDWNQDDHLAFNTCLKQIYLSNGYFPFKVFFEQALTKKRYLVAKILHNYLPEYLAHKDVQRVFNSQSNNLKNHIKNTHRDLGNRYPNGAPEDKIDTLNDMKKVYELIGYEKPGAIHPTLGDLRKKVTFKFGQQNRPGFPIRKTIQKTRTGKQTKMNIFKLLNDRQMGPMAGPFTPVTIKPPKEEKADTTGEPKDDASATNK